MEQPEIARKVNKLYTDMYEGDGAQNPSMTVRVADLETHKENTEDKVDKIEQKLDKGLWFLIATLAGVLVQIGMRAFGR